MDKLMNNQVEQHNDMMGVENTLEQLKNERINQIKYYFDKVTI